MPGLTAKVFRTFNASITLERQLHSTYPEGTSIEEMVMQYNAANREVAILCNHQRTLPKNWDENREKKKQQLDVVQHQVDELKDMLQKVKAGKKVPLMPEKYQAAIPKLEIPEGTSPEEAEKMKQEYSEKRAERAKFSHMYKSQPTEKQVEKRLETFEKRLASMKLKLKDLDDNKEVALGTSKINYMDPRITVAWCKRVGPYRNSVEMGMMSRTKCQLRRFSQRPCATSTTGLCVFLNPIGSNSMIGVDCLLLPLV